MKLKKYLTNMGTIFNFLPIYKITFKIDNNILTIMLK